MLPQKLFSKVFVKPQRAENIFAFVTVIEYPGSIHVSYKKLHLFQQAHNAGTFFHLGDLPLTSTFTQVCNFVVKFADDTDNTFLGYLCKVFPWLDTIF